MTRRERKENRIERLEEWARKRRQKAAAVFAHNEPYTSDIAFNTQPGHIPARARIIKQEDRAFESLQKAGSMESRASGIEAQLDRTVFSDDENAIEALEARASANEAKRDRMKKINAMYRKGDAAGLEAEGLSLESLREKLKTAYSWCQQPYPAYELTNLGARIRTDRERIKQLKTRQERTEQAEASPNGVTIEQCQGGYVRVTFAEKPDRSILDALRAEGFYWGSGSWAGKAESLPACVSELIAAPAADEEPEPPKGEFSIEYPITGGSVQISALPLPGMAPAVEQQKTAAAVRSKIDEPKGSKENRR